MITPVFNAGRFIEQTVASVSCQTFADWEMLIVDDGSTDNTLALARAASLADGRVRVFQPGTNRGVAAARNHALDNARGRFISFLDGDDLWEPAKLERQLDFMRARSAAIAYSGYRVIDENGVALGNVRIPASPISYRGMLRGNRIGCLTVMYDRSLAGDLRFPTFKKASDLAGWLSILRQGHVAHGLREELASYRVLRASLSRNKAKYVGSVWDIYRAQPLSTAELALCYAQYAVRGFFKHITSGAVRVRPD